ncbi:MAG TPA: sigma-70 family RNA polymerase sigma factor [Solirubrobacteraceae bacterium]|jgi:RNA polymerase sigma factor (sigma-70 family)|nr:sigma-70 family RNA polymerase sigma factor [Solirubrobacteraceae bacterium]
MLLTMSKTSTLPAHSEQELVAAIRAGDDRAFEELYAQYRDRIFAFILSKVHDHGRAEDIAQEVFMSALRRLRGADQAIAFKPWIYEIAKNACIDEFRRGSRAREVPLEADGGEFVVDRQQSPVSSVPTPVAAVESKQRLDDLRGAFGGLSATHHQLLVMREFEGMSYDEIGQRLDMTRQMVESGLFRARRKLNEEYQELATGQRCEQIQTAIESGRLRAVSTLGIRDRRRCARHLAHCQPCRHAAMMAGVDETLLRPRSIGAKIAALLPFPLWRLPWRSRGAKAASSGSHHLAGAGPAGLIPSAGSAFTFGQAAATVAVIIAGAGGGLAVHGLAAGAPGHHAASSSARRVSSSTAGAGAPVSATAARTARAHASSAHGPSAISVAGSHNTAAQPGTTRRRRGGSAPGTPGTGTAGGGSAPPASGSAQGTASQPSRTASTVVNGVTKTVSGLGHTVNGLSKTVSGTGKALGGVATGVGTTVHQVTNGVNQAVHGVTNTVGKVTSGVGNTVSTATNGVVDPTKTVSTVNKVVGSVGNGVANAGSQLANGATNTATGALGKVASGLTGGSPGAKSVLGTRSGSSGSTPAPSTPSTPAAPSTPKTPAASAANGSASASQPIASGLNQVGGLLGR